VLDRLEELKAMFEGFGDVLTGKTSLKSFETVSESLGDLKVRAGEASSEGCGGMAVRGLWGSAGAATRWGQAERVLDHLIKISTWARTMARADADLSCWSDSFTLK
jgi:hypothetical protein